MEELLSNSSSLLVVGVLAMFGFSYFNKYRNNKTIEEHKKTRDEVLKREMDIARAEIYLDSEESERKEIRKGLSRELDKELSHEEMVNFISDRYTDDD